MWKYLLVYLQYTCEYFLPTPPPHARRPSFNNSPVLLTHITATFVPLDHSGINRSKVTSADPISTRCIASTRAWTFSVGSDRQNWARRLSAAASAVWAPSSARQRGYANREWQTIHENILHTSTKSKNKRSGDRGISYILNWSVGIDQKKIQMLYFLVWEPRIMYHV